ncbi:putative Ig domain-containing protein [Leucobacter sp.]
MSVFGVPRRRTRFRAKRALALVATTAVALSTIVLGAGAAPAEAAVQNIAFEAPNNSRVILGDLASRSQRKPVAISGIGPYTVRGTDSRTQDPYEFITDFNYHTGNAGWQRESDERALTNAGTWSSNTNATFGGRSGVMQLSSSTNCQGTNTFGGLTTYCSTFGPDVYTQPFTATVGQAVSFDWAAQRVSDDYEVYAYLVKVDGNGYGTPADHTLIAYGRGATQNWTTASKEIPANGTYRFRFVNGSYDQTGGYALGSNMYIDSVVKLGLANSINFASLSDRVVADGPLTVSATAASGGAVTFSSGTTSICTVSGTTVTLTGNLGICTVLANQAGGGDYVPAETVARSFRVLAARTAPQNVGAPFVNGPFAEGDTITANEGSWVDGGSPITGTSYQWTSTVGSTTTSIPGATGASCYLVEAPGSQLRITVTKTNAIGSTSAQSTVLNGFTCGSPAAPAWTVQPLGSAVVGTPLSTTFTATGMTKPTYSLLSGSLPAGLNFNATTGVVSGTPTAAGPYEFTLRATNPTGTDDLVVTGTVNAAPGPITGGPDLFVVGGAASGAVSTTGTPAPTFTVSNGVLPDGVTLDPATGAFSGTPTSAGAYSFRITASNGIGSDTFREFTGTVEQAPGWSAQPGWTPQVGEPVDVTFTADGTPAPEYSIGEGALPNGLSLDPATGRVSGTPTTAGAYSFTIVATNDHGSSSLPVSGTVVEAPGAITGAPGHWIVGDAATGAVNATGTPAAAYAVTAGSLPEGISLDPATGAFTGTPTTAGPYAFTVTAANGVGDETTREFTGVVDQAPIWNPHDGLALVVGTEVSESATAIGTPAPAYRVSEGALPAGLSLDEATGAITGTPTEPGPYAFTLEASNGIGDPALLEFTGIVNAAPQWVDTTIAQPRVGAPFADAVFAQGTPAASYSVTAGALPKGLALNPATGDITGTPTEAGRFAFTVTADNGVGDPITHEFGGTVVQSPAQTGGNAPKLPQLVEGKPVSVDLGKGVNADPAPTYRVTSGQLPEGLSLDPATGMLTGTPTQPGRYFFVVTVDNGTEELLTFEFSGEVAAAAAENPEDPGNEQDASAGADGSGDGSGASGLVSTGAEGGLAALLTGALLLAGGLALVLRRRHRIG